MSRERQNHIQFARLIAYSESEAKFKKDTVSVQHLQECASCADLYKHLKSYRHNNVDNSHIEHLNFNECPKSDMDYISLFLTFLNSGLPAETARQLFKHLNDCYPCCLEFVRNWSLYLSIKTEE